MANNYVVSKGEMFFAPFKPGTQTPGGERKIGNSPEFTMTIETEDLDHFSSERGIREKDDSMALEVTRSGTLTTDNIVADNIALFFFGSKQALAITGATVTGEAIADVELGMTYQLGTSSTHPSGARGLTTHTVGPPIKKVIVKKASVEMVEGVDYTIDMDLARLTILAGGTLVEGDDITVDYKTSTQTRTRVISGSTAIEGSLRFISYAPKGVKQDVFIPWAKITPNGDISFIGEDWQQLPFSIEALKKSDLEAIYVDGRALVAA